MLYYLGNVFSHNLNHVWHGEVHNIVSPGQLQNDIGAQQVVALEQAGGETLVVLLFEKPRYQVLSNVNVPWLTSVTHRIL